MKMIYIAPTNLIKTVNTNYNKGHNMVLTHMVLESEEYRNTFKEIDGEKFLDNSYFELGKALPNEDILKAAELVNATTVICADGTLLGLDKFKEAGYKVMAIPTTVNQFHYFLSHDKVDYVGVSALHFKSRYDLLLNNTDKNTPKKLHILGSGDSMWEFGMLSPFKHCITSWDTSAPIWQGQLGNILRDMKVKDRTAVDFNYKSSLNLITTENIKFIEECTK